MLDSPLHELAPPEALGGSMRDFRELGGSDLIARVEPFYRWQSVRRQHGLWSYSRSTEEAPQPVCAAMDDAGNRFRGVNFGSQDYLSLASHPAIKEAAKATIDEYGVHSAGSSALSGNTKYSLRLEQYARAILGPRTGRAVSDRLGCRIRGHPRAGQGR